jgi:hypothetical protein
MTNIEWTDAFEQRLREKLEEEYDQADKLVVAASHANKPFKKGGIIDAKRSADSMIKWIKKEFGV